MEISDYFRLTVKIYIKKLGRGVQKKIAESIGIHVSYLSEYLNGKKKISENARVRFAEYIGFNYEELVALGRKLSKQQPELFNKQRDILSGKFKPDLLKSVRRENNFTIRQFAQALYISETEYIFKEDGLIPFTFRELSILFEKISKLRPEFDSHFRPASVLKNIDNMKHHIDRFSDEAKIAYKKELLEKSAEMKKELSEAYKKIKQL